MQYILELHKEDTLDCEMFGVLSTSNILQHGVLLVQLKNIWWIFNYPLIVALILLMPAAHRVAVSLMAVGSHGTN